MLLFVFRGPREDELAIYSLEWSMKGGVVHCRCAIRFHEVFCLTNDRILPHFGCHTLDADPTVIGGVLAPDQLCHGYILLRCGDMFRPVFSYLPTLIPKIFRSSPQPYTRHNHLRFPTTANRRPQLLLQSLVPFFQAANPLLSLSGLTFVSLDHTSSHCLLNSFHNNLCLESRGHIWPECLYP